MKQVFKAIENFNKAIFDEGILRHTDKSDYYDGLSYRLYNAPLKNLGRIFMDYYYFVRDPKLSIPGYWYQIRELVLAKYFYWNWNRCPNREKNLPRRFDDITNFNEAVFDQEILPREMEEKYYKYLRYLLIKEIQKAFNWEIMHLTLTPENLDHYNAVMPKLTENFKTEAGYIDLTDEEEKHYEKTLHELLEDAFKQSYLDVKTYL